MEYDYRRYQNPLPVVFPNYYAHERAAPLSLTQVPRANPRTYPVAGSAGIRMRTGGIREDEIQETHANARRRIAIACARCRKRKIRCSGDPGDGSGCIACRTAGVDVRSCTFQRVGSTDAAAAFNAVLLSSSQGNGLSNFDQSNVPVPIYSTSGNAIYNHRSWTGAQYTPQIDTRFAIYQQPWTVPCSEDTSPVETYSLEQPTSCVPNSSAMANVHGQGCRWNQPSQRTFLEQDTVSSYTASGMPHMQTANVLTTTKTEAMSPLNMTSVQSALPSPVGPHREPAIPRRKLPMPQPSPAQGTRNTVDLIQDQRLRSSQMVRGAPMSLNASLTKPHANWAGDILSTEARSTAAVANSSTELVAPNPTLTSASNDAGMAYASITATSTAINGAATTTTQPQLSFNTTPLLEAMSNHGSTATYSNFRDYAQPTSSSSDTLSVFARQPSRYSFSAESAMKRDPLNATPNEAALVSGQPYTPLDQPLDAHETTKLENRPISAHRGSVSKANHTF